jgi:hypothetical protein
MKIKVIQTDTPAELEEAVNEFLDEIKGNVLPPIHFYTMTSTVWLAYGAIITYSSISLAPTIVVEGMMDEVTKQLRDHWDNYGKIWKDKEDDACDGAVTPQKEVLDDEQD